MGMNTYVKGFRPPNDKWKAMKAIYDACESGGIAVPDEVDDFFNGEPPDKAGVEVDLEVKKLGLGCVRPYRDDSREGIEVDVTKLPKGVTILRFVNSW
jgi:hypothetical protein